MTSVTHRIDCQNKISDQIASLIITQPEWRERVRDGRRSKRREKERERRESKKVHYTATYPGEVGHHFLDEGAHGRHVDDLELVQVDRVVSVHVLVDLPQDAQQRHVGLTSTLETEKRGTMGKFHKINSCGLQK